MDKKPKTVEEIYAALCAPMTPHELPGKRGPDGKPLKYATVHDVIQRLNDALGVDGWSWDLHDQGYDLNANAAWARGTLTACFPTREVRRSAIGGQDVNRGMSLGDCMKAAGTDAMKKSAASIGVALEFSEKDGPPVTHQRETAPGSDGGRRIQPVRPPTRGPVNQAPPPQPNDGQDAPTASGVGDEVVALIGRFVKVGNKAQYESARAESSALWSVIDDEDKARITEAATAARERIAAPVGA